jgi:hypothetical protein
MLSIIPYNAIQQLTSLGMLHLNAKVPEQNLRPDLSFFPFDIHWVSAVSEVARNADARPLPPPDEAIKCHLLVVQHRKSSPKPNAVIKQYQTIRHPRHACHASSCLLSLQHFA